MGDNTDAVIIIETLNDAGKESGLEIRAEKSKCMLQSHRQNSGTMRHNYSHQIL
jgi:hypothetical protein